MIFEEKRIILKDGRNAVLKSPCIEDAEKMLDIIDEYTSDSVYINADGNI